MSPVWTMWKWQLTDKHAQRLYWELEAPEGTIFRTVGEQDGEVVLWGEVDPSPEAEKVKYRFLLLPTGRLCRNKKSRRFIGTVNRPRANGDYSVVHVFMFK